MFRKWFLRLLCKDYQGTLTTLLKPLHRKQLQTAYNVYRRHTLRHTGGFGSCTGGHPSRHCRRHRHCSRFLLERAAQQATVVRQKEKKKRDKKKRKEKRITDMQMTYYMNKCVNLLQTNM